MTKYILFFITCFNTTATFAQQPVPLKPRILVSTDIGGTDPDDNQSLAHLLMYSGQFHIEGLVSSPSYGSGSAKEIFRMIDLYEKDLPGLQKHQKGFETPAHLRSVTKQGRQGAAPYKGYSTATEGSDWMIQCAGKNSDQPLWILVWGGLDDLAQALHDAPAIKQHIKVYWIGGPNKKWSANSYAYIAAYHPDLWFIEVNASYYGFFSNNHTIDSVQASGYYNQHIRGAGHLGNDFKNYYDGEIKMGDTPSLLYMMDGDPNDPGRESWGGSFEKISHSARRVFNRITTIRDTVAFCTVVEFQFDGPQLNIPADSACFTMETGYKNDVQKWAGYYIGDGRYAIKYAPKQAETLYYNIKSGITGFPSQEGVLVVSNLWPGKRNATDYILGNHWYSDATDPDLYDGKIQGGKTVLKWQQAALQDWAKRWAWLR